MKFLFVFLFAACLLPLAGTDVEGSTEWQSSLENENDSILIESSIDIRLIMDDGWKASCYFEAVPPAEDELASDEIQSGASLDFPLFKGGILSLGGTYILAESPFFPSPGQDRTKTEFSLDKRSIFKERIGAALFTPRRSLVLHGLQDAAHRETGILWMPGGDPLFGKTGIIYSRERTLNGADDSWFFPEKEDIREDLLIFMGGLGYETGQDNKLRISGDVTYSAPRYTMAGHQYFIQGCWYGERTDIILSGSYSTPYWRSAKGELSRWRYGGGAVFDRQFGSSVIWRNEVSLFRPAPGTGESHSCLNLELESCLEAAFFTLTAGWDRKKEEIDYAGEISLFFHFGNLILTGEDRWHYEIDNDEKEGQTDLSVLLQLSGKWDKLSFLLEGTLEFPMEQYWERGEYNIEGEIILTPADTWEISCGTNYSFQPSRGGSELYLDMKISRVWE